MDAAEKISVQVDGFDLEEFERENPIFDPFVERLNEREVAEPLICWGCLGVYDRATGDRISEADPEGEEVTSMRELCGSCVGTMKIRPSNIEY